MTSAMPRRSESCFVIRHPYDYLTTNTTHARFFYSFFTLVCVF